MDARSRAGTELEPIELDKVIEGALNDRLFPGIACGVWKEGRPVYRRLAGFSTFEPEPEAMADSTLFDMASLTKPLATALLVMKARDAGVLGLEDELGRFIPALPPSTAALSLRSLLTHTSGLPAIPALERFFPDASDIDVLEARRRLTLIEPEAEPGIGVVYSCTGYMLLGLVLERVSGLGIGRLFADEIASPLGLESACFSPPPGLRSSIAPTEVCPWRGRRMRGEVHDESAFCLGGEAGNAGLFSNLDDAARIGLMYAEGGVSSGQRFLSLDSWELMTGNQTPGLNEARGCGFMVHCPESQDGPDWPEGSFGHTGFTGTSLYIEPGRRLMVVALANRVYFGREATAGRIIPFRKALHRAAIRAFG